MMSVAARLYVPAPAFLLTPLPTARPAVRLCAEQWDEERECQEHLQALAQKSAAVNKLREVLRPESRAALGGGLAGASSVSEAEPGLWDEVLEADLWDEELEAMAHLQEMAAWEKEVGKVKAVIETAEARKASTSTAFLAVTEAEVKAEAEAEAEAQPSGDGSEGSAGPRVFDGVLDEEGCDAVHRFATREGLGHRLPKPKPNPNPNPKPKPNPNPNPNPDPHHRLYHREAGPSTPLEVALETALAALADDAPVVEYW